MNAPRDPVRLRVLMVGVEPAMAELFAEWLAPNGFAADCDDARGEPPAALMLVDLPFPRQGGRERLAQLREAWPGVPLIVLSPTLLPGVSPQGEVARSLGAAAVLPSPVSREILCKTVVDLVSA